LPHRFSSRRKLKNRGCGFCFIFRRIISNKYFSPAGFYERRKNARETYVPQQQQAIFLIDLQLLKHFPEEANAKAKQRARADAGFAFFVRG
jgi:hypothetical protein